MLDSVRNLILYSSMDDYFKEANARHAARKQKDALDHIKRLRQIEEEQNTLIATIDALKENANKPRANDPSPMLAATAKQIHILGGLFDHYIEKSKRRETHDHNMIMALKTQQQLVRTLHIWHKLNS